MLVRTSSAAGFVVMLWCISSDVTVIVALIILGVLAVAIWAILSIRFSRLCTAFVRSYRQRILLALFRGDNHVPSYPQYPSPYTPYQRDAASYQQASHLTNVQEQHNMQEPQNLRAPQNMPDMPAPLPAQGQYMATTSNPEPAAQQTANTPVNPNALVAHEQEAMTVSTFVHSANHFLHNLGPALIKGEISAVTPRSHLYFTLKDKTSSVQCLMFQSKMRNLSFKPEIGQQVLVAGFASLYNKTGSFTLQVDRMELAGQGLLMEQLRLLELKLEQEGLFARQRPLPRIIQRVAVVTSLQGMARDDFIYNATTRNPLLEIILFETKVQGADAPLSICNSLNFVYQYAAAWDIDVIVLTRGGGSFEDLLCFYDENVARMVARSPVPIISAVGHDKNSPICDRAADMRVSTPTAAAIAVTPITRDDILAYLNQATSRATNALLSLVDNLSLKYDQLWRSLERSPVLWQLQSRESALNALTQRLDQDMQWHLQHARETISNQEKLLLQHAFSDRINAANQRWFNSMSSLERFTSRLDSYEQRLSAAEHSLQNVKALETAAQSLAQLQQRLLLGYATLQNRVHTASTTCSNLEQRLQEAISQHLARAQRSWQQNYQALQLNYEQHLQPQLQQMQTKEALLYSKLLQLNPLYQLDHGWSLTTLDGKHSVAAADLSEGSEIITLLKGAEVHSTVTQVIPKEHVAREESVAEATTTLGDAADDDGAGDAAHHTTEASPAE